MNVLLSSCVHWYNAEAAYALAVGETLRGAGHTVWVLTQPGTENARALQSRGLRTVTDIPLYSGNPLRLRKALRALAEFQQREAIDIVNVFRGRELPLHVLANRFAPRATGSTTVQRPPLLVRTRGDARPVSRGPLSRLLYRRLCHALIAASPPVQRQMTAALGLPPQRVPTIYYPTDVAEPAQGGASSEQPSAQRSALLRELGLPEDAQLLAVVGRSYPEKGHPLLLEAFKRLLEQHPQRQPKIALLVLDRTAGDQRRYLQHLRAYAQGLGLGDHLRWLGPREDVRDVMGLADLGVIPSVASEVNCRVAVEFASMGTPVVALPTGALPDVVRDGVTGLVTAQHSAQELADALDALLCDPERRAEMGRQARVDVAARFSRAEFVKRTLEVYQQALQKRAPTRRRA